MMINNEHIQGPGNPKEPRKLTWLNGKLVWLLCTISWLKWKLNWLNHSTSTGTWQPHQILGEVNVGKGEAGVVILDDAVVKMEA